MRVTRLARRIRKIPGNLFPGILMYWMIDMPKMVPCMAEI
jgi:hypothetical protein